MEEVAGELEEVVKSLPSDAVNHLFSLGLCVRCIFRIFGVEITTVYASSSLSPSIFPSIAIAAAAHQDDKLCTLCLGILQFRFHRTKDDNNNNDVPLLISQMVKREGYHCDSFSLEVSIPPVILHNDNYLRSYMKTKYGSQPWFQQTCISAKDALKFSLLPPLQNLLQCKSSVGSLRIRLTYTESNEADKCSDNVDSCKRRKTDECNLVGQKSISSSLENESSGCCKFLLEMANEPCHFTYLCYRTPLYFGGRYLKYSRNVSQTRWIIDDERMGEASVEEIIGGNILQVCQADSFKFHAAGREDIDVRMLGPGRPFLVEVQNARQVPSEMFVKDIEKKINTMENKLVRVKNLKLVGSHGWDLMREGEAEKQKQYAALVWISRPLKDEDFQHVSSVKDLKVLQRTPIRVLHRRSPLEREKIIHWMKIEAIAGSSQYFLLHLCTQAGTYIKEFVHGDLGRTHPSIGSMFGCRAEILQLDVTDIKMECFLN
ncbi:tRNA pseudouridine synthase Pus10 [Trifolium repens]|nr:tRNA pseudouridine synthase Pus10 [Trifolium repens]